MPRSHSDDVCCRIDEIIKFVIVLSLFSLCLQSSSSFAAPLRQADVQTISAIRLRSCFRSVFATMRSYFFDVISYSPKALQLILLLSALFFVGFEELVTNNGELTVKSQ